MQNYWKMNRLGFINFWKFKKEEFFFSDGCALVRGHNGSGKSIVIQSAVTFLLDGSMRKLDPSGSNAREMSFYLIGEDRKESTGYVFMEFKKGNNFATIGIGMRAVRNRGVDFWGFGIRDGRRPEKNFSFYKNGVPLTKQECKALVKSGEENFFTNKRKDYEREVNRMLFGLSPYRYKELVSLLSEIRKPIAGADRNAGLKFIYDKLNNSLSALREEDFDALVSSMEMMDEYNEKLQIIKEDYEKICSLSYKYQNYTESLIYKKHLLYKKESAKEKQLKKEADKAKEEYDLILKKRKEAYDELIGAEIELSDMDIFEEFSDQEKRNARLSALEDMMSETEDKRSEAKENRERCEYDVQKIKERLKETDEEIHSLEEEFTWTPDLEDRINNLISLYLEVENIPKAAFDMGALKMDIISYLNGCMIFQAEKCREELINILDSNLEPEEKIKKSQECLLKAFLLINNRYVERNAFLKHQLQSSEKESEKEEIMENSKKLDLLIKEYSMMPSLAPIILLNPKMEEKREELKRKIAEAENSTLFETRKSAKEYRILHDQIRSYRHLIKENDSGKKELEDKESLFTYFDSQYQEYEEKILEIKGEINVLKKSLDEHFTDILSLREKVVELKSMIRNFDSYVIPQRKEILEEKTAAWEKQKTILEMYQEYALLPDTMKGKFKEGELLDQEHILVEEFMKQKMDLHRYSPVLLRNENSEENFYELNFTYQGEETTPVKLQERLRKEIEEKNSLLSQEENNIYQRVLMDCLVEKINHHIDSAKEWIQRIRENMLSLETTSGIVFGIKWVRIKEIPDFSEYFRVCMENYREESEDLNYMECIMECLDYRNWFEFRLEMNGSPLSNKRFLTLSGGERATAIYSTLLSALTTMFNECRKEDHPRLFALDEAFTVVDGENIESVFGFINSVGLDYLMNSQTLWGTYPTVNSLSISNLTNLKDNQSVIVHRFLWKNNRKIPQFTGN